MSHRLHSKRRTRTSGGALVPNGSVIGVTVPSFTGIRVAAAVLVRSMLLLCCLLLALPGRAGQDDGEMELREIGEGVFLHTSFRALEGIGFYPSNGLVYVRGEDAYIVDTPWLEKDTAALVQWIESSGYRLRASLSTHFHEDRSAGIGYLNRLGAPTYASAMTNQLLRAQGRPVASREFTDGELWLVPEQVFAYYPGGGHSLDNIVVWLARERILFGGCLIRPGASRSLGNTADAAMADWADSVANVRAQFPEPTRVIPGHGEPGSVELLQHTIDLLQNGLD